ncbi:hypothetical protein WICPIJ_006956 [Wickerhamomyces pijperi]|uniref:Uncharacterized protein n=1 Tax=Wickerhamomyces pijperi TaxID=599730 RepID=A0A9P8Q1G7_WICPI|nr:hypothetical protein WICPIJ_006956 [Wickerhamomyces pijperi]
MDLYDQLSYSISSSSSSSSSSSPSPSLPLSASKTDSLYSPSYFLANLEALPNSLASALALVFNPLNSSLKEALTALLENTSNNFNPLLTPPMTMFPLTSTSGAKEVVKTLPTPKSRERTMEGPWFSEVGNFHNLTTFSPIAEVINNSGMWLLICKEEIPASWAWSVHSGLASLRTS